MDRRNEVCSNSKRISLLCLVGELCGGVLIERIVCSTDSAIGEEQCRIWSGVRCTKRIFAARHVSEVPCEKRVCSGSS